MIGFVKLHMHKKPSVSLKATPTMNGIVDFKIKLF
ncbi:hypothetical protein SAMN05444280_101114 [Tangfeifania diversioriginum]|uniref:Uncharacterized protein n=1 Tax=Tangfeifania diversioriginum TaxID=1168035 RepID=A0A1M6A8S5_9BACT|nr:hypothetical protein SAMN05444280_101114 [Tangfeifania diversioriginum]